MHNKEYHKINLLLERKLKFRNEFATLIPIRRVYLLKHSKLKLIDNAELRQIILCDSYTNRRP